MKEYLDTDRHVYAVLECIPDRRWGNRDLAAHFWRLRSEISKKTKAGKTLNQEEVKSLALRFEQSCSHVLKQLKVSTAGTISFSRTGKPVFDAGAKRLVAYKDVPTAIVLCVEPSGHSGSIRVVPSPQEDIEIEADVLNQRTFFRDFSVLPVTARCKPGTHNLAVEFRANGRQTQSLISMEVRSSALLKGSLIRSSDKKPVAAKTFVEGSDGRLYVVPGEYNYQTQNWYAYFQPRFSYADKAFSIPLPPGRYHITAMKGYGYRDAEYDIDVEADKTTHIVMNLEQMTPLEERGWYAADLHTHTKHFSLKMLRSEDINVVADTRYSTEKALPLTVNPEISDAAHIIFGQQEIEHWNFGNSFYINIPHTVTDIQTRNPTMTPMFFYDQQCHELGGVTLRWLRSRPFAPKGNGQQQPELAVDVALGHLDVWQVLDNSMQSSLDTPEARWNGEGWGRSSLYEHTYKTWYALMNCGLRVPISAGTSYGRLSRLGFNRVYVKCPTNLTLEEFARALKKGDGFVTNGPLLWLRANGKPPGDDTAFDKPGPVELEVEIYSQHPVELVEMLQNGRVIFSKKLTGFDGHLTFTHTVQVQTPSWFAARCFGAHEPRYAHSACRNQFAHTNASFITVAGKTPSSSRDAARFVSEIDRLIAFVPDIPQELRGRSMQEFMRARTYFANMAKDSSRPFNIE
ncbi:MAG: CehA/McbA family metallohydrolase [Phycisphaerales bacterium]|nr:MAG: CehA/McbA family metallohydrolase [Phycisphaerales bacterium]